MLRLYFRLDGLRISQPCGFADDIALCDGKSVFAQITQERTGSPFVKRLKAAQLHDPHPQSAEKCVRHSKGRGNQDSARS